MEQHRGTIALGLLIIALFGWLKADISGLKWEMSQHIAGVRRDIARLDQGQSELRERMATVETKIAHLEGLIEGIRDSILAQVNSSRSGS